MPTPIVPSSAALWCLSSGYRDAGDATLAMTRSGTYSGLALFPCFFSYFRCIELALKSVLVAHSVTDDEIARTLSHRISKLITRVESFVSLSTIGIETAGRDILDRFSDDYSEKWFEYPDNLWKEHPDLEELQALAHQICGATQVYKPPMRF